MLVAKMTLVNSVPRTVLENAKYMLFIHRRHYLLKASSLSGELLANNQNNNTIKSYYFVEFLNIIGQILRHLPA